MKSTVILTALATLCGSALAAEMCGQWDSLTTGPYILYNNLWGRDAATSGQQCTELDAASGSKIAWHTSWSWEGGPYNVKSFANANLIFSPRLLGEICGIPSTVKHSYRNPGVSNVAYDIFLDTVAGNEGWQDYEVMIWLAAYGGAGPISSTGSPVATLTVAGVQWSLYDGYNGEMHVYSFVASAPQTDFKADALEFLRFLVDTNRLSENLYVNTIQVGTEPFIGTDAELTVSEFSIELEY